MAFGTNNGNLYTASTDRGANWQTVSHHRTGTNGGIQPHSIDNQLRINFLLPPEHATLHIPDISKPCFAQVLACLCSP